MQLYITYGDIATAESMKTIILLERRFFTSFVTMLDLKYQECRKLVIIMQTELGVRGGLFLSLSLARSETILVVEGLLHWCGLDSVGWSLVDLAWVVGGSLVVFPVPGMWACFSWFLLACPGLWGFACCLCWLCPYVGFGLFIRCLLCSG